MLKKKEVYESKKNPREDDVNIHLRTFVRQEKKQKKTKTKQKVKKSDVVNDVDKRKDDWESEYESDSYKLLEVDSTDSSDNEKVKSVKKHRHMTKMITNTFNPKTPMKDINKDPGLYIVGFLLNFNFDNFLNRKARCSSIWSIYSRAHESSSSIIFLPLLALDSSC